MEVPRTLPCGTPDTIYLGSEMASQYLVYYLRSRRNDLSQAEVQSFAIELNIFNNMQGFSVSNALEKSMANM